MSNINLSNNLIIDSDDDIIEEAYNIDTPYNLYINSNINNIQFNIGSIYINSVYDSDNDIIDEANIDSDDIINNTLESTIYSDNIINNILESTIDTNILPTESTVGIGHFIEIIGSHDQFFNINRNNSYIQQNNISGIIEAENMEDIRVTLDDTEFDSIKIEELQEDLNEKCSICMMEMNKGDRVSKLCCKHNFHNSCIIQWLTEYNYKCPVCRKECGKAKYNI